MTSIGEDLEAFQLEQAISNSLKVKIEEEDTTEPGANTDEEAQGTKRKREDEKMVQDEERKVDGEAIDNQILEEGDLVKVFESTILRDIQKDPMNAYQISLRLTEFDAFGALQDVCERFPLGLQIEKQFGKKMYKGAICSGPKILNSLKTLVWKVKYEDGDSEELEGEEIMPLITEPFVINETLHL